jgi:hypothetical protein
MEVFKAKLRIAIQRLHALEHGPCSKYWGKKKCAEEIEKVKNEIRLLKKAIEIGASLDNSVTYTFEVV